VKRANLFLSTLGLFLLMLVAQRIVGQPGTKPNDGERDELSKIRQLVWDSYFSNDQERLKRLIGEDFLTINPGEEHWRRTGSFSPNTSVRLRSSKVDMLLDIVFSVQCCTTRRFGFHRHFFSAPAISQEVCHWWERS
jgi:hypothetical protein